jgi:hypothetical protein
VVVHLFSFNLYLDSAQAGPLGEIGSDRTVKEALSLAQKKVNVTHSTGPLFLTNVGYFSHSFDGSFDILGGVERT